MCGHVGIAGKLETRDEKTMKRLLMYDYFRGPDSTGLAAVTATDVKIAKLASHPLDLFENKGFEAALKGWSSKAFIGHNRAATRGVVNKTNAHPYQFGDITGAHNGTLTQKSWDELQEAAGEKTGTDSAAIFAAIDKIGIDDTSKLLQGAWSLVWYDAKDKTINFLRNDQRPMWYAYTKTFDRMFWASEHPMIRAAVAMADNNQGYDLAVSEEGFSMFATKENWHYRLELAALCAGSDTQPKPRVKELKGKEPEPVKAATTHFPQYPHGTRSSTVGVTSTTGSTTSGSSTATRLVVDIETTAADPYGGYLSKQEFELLAQYGCGYCREDVEFYDEGVVIYEKSGIVLCPSCSGRTKSRIYTKPSHHDEYISENTGRILQTVNA